MTPEGAEDFDPLDEWCPTCNAAPTIRCVWTPARGPVRSREPHASRVSEARWAAWRRTRKAERRRRSG